MKRFMLVISMLLVSMSVMSKELVVEGKPMIAVGVRAGTNKDINDNPAIYSNLKFALFKMSGGDTSIRLLAPGIGIQTGSGDTNLNLSIAPIVVENRAGWGFGVDVFMSTDSSKSGKSNLGFFIGKSF